jgi:hypothetical protein
VAKTEAEGTAEQGRRESQGGVSGVGVGPWEDGPTRVPDRAHVPLSACATDCAA